MWLKAGMELTPLQKLRGRAFMFAMGFKRRMTLGARVMAMDGDKVLLVRHTYLPGWFLPGGGVEVGEPAIAAAERELFEETGYRAAALQLFGFYYSPTSTSIRDHVALFITREVHAERSFRPSLEIAEIGWFPRDALPPTVHRGTGERIAEVFSGSEPAPIW
jgi:ADP-ribose pyrophosphatase YjhB (NUDIX family)